MVCIADLAEVKGGKRMPANAFLVTTPTSHPYIRGRDIRNGKIAFDQPMYVRDEDFEPIQRYTVNRGDVCITIVGNIGDIGITPPHLHGASLTENAVKLVNLREDIDARFLAFALLAPEAQSQMKQSAAGAAQPKLGIYKVNEIRVAVPPFPVQQRIADILSAYDELIENSQRRIKILEAMARAIYREWFVHFRFPGHEHHPRVPSPLGEIPQGWEVKKLGEISSYINRGITPRYDEEGDSVVINQKCVREQRLSLEPARRQSKAIPTEKQVCFGDVLINSTGVGTLGRVGQVYENLENCTVDTHVTIVRAASNTDLDFYGCCLLSHQETFERLGIGATGQTELGRAAISEIELVAPPTDVQRQFGMAVKGMRLAVVTHSKQIQNLRRTRDLLLPRLLSGQIEVGAADDLAFAIRE
jgi:type I restriction enzyme, S subunit